MFEEYSVGQLANQKLRELLEKGIKSELLEKLQNKIYSKNNFGVNYSLLVKDEGIGKPERHYYALPLSINKNSFFLTNEWFENETNNDRPLLLRWMKDHGIPEITEEEINQSLTNNTQRNVCNKNNAHNKKGEVWSPWTQPTEDESYELAKTITKYTHFLSPEIVRAITEDNNSKQAHYKAILSEAGIDPELYLWENSPCAFPGAKRADGGDKERQSDNALIIDPDGNFYPLYLWKSIFKLHSFQPDRYSLAHLIDHKGERNRMAEEFDFPSGSHKKPLYGLFTCPTNAAYVPSALMRPTDFNGSLRNLLFQKAFDLYKDCCNILPADMHLKEPLSERWHFSNFKWAEPIGKAEDMKAFFNYRNKNFEKKLNQAILSLKTK